MVGSFVTYDFVKAMPAKAAAMVSHDTPLDDNMWVRCYHSDQAMEPWPRASPAIVNVTVTSRGRANMAGGDLQTDCR